MLHHVNVQVSDVTRSETFYRKLLGLPESRLKHAVAQATGGVVAADFFTQ